MIQPMIVQPSSRFSQKTSQWGTSRMVAIIHGSMYPAVMIATTIEMILVAVQDWSRETTV